MSVIALMVLGLRGLGPGGLALCGAMLVAVGLGVVAPLWRIAHPTPLVYQGHLGGAMREAFTPPARASGRHLLEVEAPTTGGNFVLLAGVDGATDRIDGPVTRELQLHEGQRINLFVERSDGRVSVRIRPLGIPWVWARLAAAVAAVLALWADALLAEARFRGSLATAVGTGAAYVAMLEPTVPESAAAYAGLGLLALMAGLATGTMALISGGFARRVTRSAQRRGAARARLNAV
jgi:hypothetical protein